MQDKIMAILLVVLVIFTPVQASAGWFTDFCSRWLVADDPYPYSDFTFNELVRFYQTRRNEEAKKEMVMRYKLGMLNEIQARYVEAIDREAKF